MPARSKKAPARKRTRKSAATARKQAKPKPGGAGTRRSAETPLDRVREIVLAWPETEERLSHGMATFWGGRKTFARFADDHHGDGRTALWIKSDLDTQESLVEADPERFFVPPYVGPSGWVGAIVDGTGATAVDWAFVASLLEDGYRAVAPRRALLALESAKSGGA